MPYVDLEIGKIYRVKTADIAIPAWMDEYGNWRFVDSHMVTSTIHGLYKEFVMVVGFKYHDHQSLQDEPVLVAILHGEKTYILGRHQLEALQEKL